MSRRVVQIAYKNFGQELNCITFFSTL